MKRYVKHLGAFEITSLFITVKPERVKNRFIEEKISHVNIVNIANVVNLRGPRPIYTRISSISMIEHYVFVVVRGVG
jgi:hypothetical protein